MQQMKELLYNFQAHQCDKRLTIVARIARINATSDWNRHTAPNPNTPMRQISENLQAAENPMTARQQMKENLHIAFVDAL